MDVVINPEQVLPLAELEECLLDYVERDPCHGGFTRKRTEEILTSAVHYARQVQPEVVEKARRFDAIRVSNREAMRRYRERKRERRTER